MLLIKVGILAATLSWNQSADVLKSFPFASDNPSTNTLFQSPREFDSIYYEGDEVTLTDVNEHDVFVYSYDRDGNYSQYSADSSPLTLTPPVGYYLAATIGDRASFVVLPSDYKGSQRIGTETSIATSRRRRTQRAKIGTLRTHKDTAWKRVQPAENVPPKYSKVEQWIDAMPADSRLLLTASFAPTWATNDLVNGFSKYLQGLCTFLTNYPNRDIVIQVDNEPTQVPQGAVPWVHTGKRWQDALGEAMNDALPKCRTIAPHLEYSIGNFDTYHNAWMWGNFHEFNTNGYYNADYVSYYPTYTTIYAQDENTLLSSATNYTAYNEVQNIRDIGITNKVQVGEAYLKGQSVLGEFMPVTGSCGTEVDWFTASNRTVWNQLQYFAHGVDLFVAHVFAENVNGNIDYSQNCATHGFAPSWGAPSRGIRAPAAWWLIINHWIQDKKLFQIDLESDTQKIAFYDLDKCVIAMKRKEMVEPVMLEAPDDSEIFTIWGRTLGKSHWLGAEPVFIETTTEQAVRLFAEGL